MARYERPSSLDEALALLDESKWRILAGGTDFFPAQGARPINEDVLDVNDVKALRGVSQTADHVVIGARTTWTDIARSDLPAAFDALKLAAREVGSVQIQNAGTVAGNLCNASPAADGVPPLLVLDAEVEIMSVRGVRHLALGDFIRGYRETAVAAGEMVTAVRVPRASAQGRSHFLKLGARRYMVISIAMVAVRMDVDPAGRICDAAVAVGACSAVAQRIPSLEEALRGQALDALRWSTPEPEHFAALSPIDDVRGSATYRRDTARELVGRALAELAGAREPHGRAA